MGRSIKKLTKIYKFITGLEKTRASDTTLTGRVMTKTLDVPKTECDDQQREFAAIFMTLYYTDTSQSFGIGYS
jgi:hypothetical protein